MSRIMNQAAVTMNQLQNKLDVIGNNISNNGTTGYKSRQVEFSSLLNQQINNLTSPANAQGRVTPDGIRVGTGAGLGAIHLNQQQGSLIETSRALDAALTGENTFFQVNRIENGQEEMVYTRDGSFYLSPIAGDRLALTTSDGHPVIGQNGPIEIQDGFDSVEWNDRGQLVVNRGGNQAIEAELAIVEAVRPSAMEAEGNNFFAVAANADEDEVIQAYAGEGAVIQPQALEQSNVDLSQAMTDMMAAQRLYQLNSRSITMGDQMLGLVNTIRS
ncbi:flagellar hook-basal body protein [Oceanobacillus sp. J11TS1]|uniref:flagellar hook-basal body protein n=1 Tax=Oceanobacillus sp. J11TS1 TaxID=2807191 RepID=UPI001B0CD869|nr:flagellar hook-basal body protein [Oceanobacillus sp. J11TS1]GIO25251.1 flagellar hook-basal body complex protein FlhP [Oceanobacillus sp. J11TS1]